MTGIERGRGGPPWSVDLLADLQAGALDPAAAADLWPQVSADPEAREVLAALEATQADLREYALAPAPPMPAHFAARLDAALAAESQARAQVHIPRQASPPPHAMQEPGHAQVVSLDEARKRRNRRLGWGAGFLVAAAAAVGIAFAAVPSGDNGPTVAQPPADSSAQQSGPLAFKSSELGEQQLNAARKQNDYGPFSDKQKLTACLAANGIATKAEPLGGRQVTVDGKPGTLLVLAHGAGQFRLVVVGPECGPGNPAKLADKTV
jgi:hypothetical protein